MLAKKARLTTQEVREILHSGRSIRATSLSAKYISATGSKAAVVISVKVAKSAVVRNKLRRAVYQKLRTSLPKNIHAVFFLQKPALDPLELNSLCLKLS